MPDFLLTALQHPFTWGLLTGLAAALLLLLKNAGLRARIRALESQVVKSHEASLLAHSRLQEEAARLREANQNLRDKLAQFAHSPRGQLANRLDAFERAVARLTKDAPGFAQAWASVLEQAQAEITAEIEGARRPPFGLGGLLPFLKRAPSPAMQPGPSSGGDGSPGPEKPAGL